MAAFRSNLLKNRRWGRHIRPFSPTMPTFPFLVFIFPDLLPYNRGAYLHLATFGGSYDCLPLEFPENPPFAKVKPARFHPLLSHFHQFPLSPPFSTVFIFLDLVRMGKNLPFFENPAAISVRRAGVGVAVNPTAFPLDGQVLVFQKILQHFPLDGQVLGDKESYYL